MREQAMDWWNSLTNEAKYLKIIKHKELVTGYPDRAPSDLTGREIEKLYNAETGFAGDGTDVLPGDLYPLYMDDPQYDDLASCQDYTP